MIYSTKIPSTSNTLNNLLVNESSHSSYIQKEFTDKKDMMINIFSAYVEPLINESNHSELLQEWTLNIDATEYDQNIDADLYKPSDKNKLNLHNRDKLWPTSIKYTIRWFPFLAIMEHTAKIMEKNNGLISSLLKVFAMFE